MRRSFLISFLLAGWVPLAVAAAPAQAAKHRVLILSGSNNHHWQETTPAIQAALEETGRFQVDVENQVETLKPGSFAPYALILSNFNAFGRQPPSSVWDAATRKSFIEHMAKGRGLVVVHAGSSEFYDWPEFQKLACGNWGPKTHHSAIHVEQVRFTAEASPITAGLQPFWIRDEFWHDIALAPGIQALATAGDVAEPKDSTVQHPIVFSTQAGRARGFALFLGHDGSVMKNVAWRTLLQRGTEWAATGKVTLPIPNNWPATQADAEAPPNPSPAASPADAPAPTFSWQQDVSSLALVRGGKTVWRLVMDAKQPKTCFHPLATVDGEVLTDFEPADHPWHRGLWWSWKFINGLNYWEEDPVTHASQGVTELTRVTVKPGADFAAQAELCFSYHPPRQPAVLTEVRHLSISHPDADGLYRIDWTSEFTAGAAAVKLDRTVPAHLGGVSYGGYAGLSLRLAPDLKGWAFRSSGEKNQKPTGKGQSARWADLSGPAAGITIFDHPGNLRHPSPWYLYDTAPCLFFSPAILFNEPIELAPQQSLKLSYRVLVHSQALATAQIETEWRGFTAPAKP
jgi:type 1 glutamine amidotransferase